MSDERGDDFVIRLGRGGAGTTERSCNEDEG